MNSPLFLGLFLLFGSTSFSPPRVELLYTTDYYRDEIKNQTGEEWFGFFKTENGFKLKKCVIKVEPIHDSCSGDAANEKTGRRVTVDQPEEPMVLIRNLDSLREGELKTVYSGQDFLYPGQSLSLKWEEEEYCFIHVHGNVPEPAAGDSENWIFNYSIQFSQNKFYQPSKPAQRLLLEDKLGLDSPRVILWIGDLDRDNKPDLLIDEPLYLTMPTYTLYLSSLAEGDDLVKRAAQLYKLSC